VPAVGVVSECVHDVPLGIQAGGVADELFLMEGFLEVKRFLNRFLSPLFLALTVRVFAHSISA
jgi:hypothetical protein